MERDDGGGPVLPSTICRLTHAHCHPRMSHCWLNNSALEVESLGDSKNKAGSPSYFFPENHTVDPLYMHTNSGSLNSQRVCAYANNKNVQLERELTHMGIGPTSEGVVLKSRSSLCGPDLLSCFWADSLGSKYNLTAERCILLFPSYITFFCEINMLSHACFVLELTLVFIEPICSILGPTFVYYLSLFACGVDVGR